MICQHCSTEFNGCGKKYCSAKCRIAYYRKVERSKLKEMASIERSLNKKVCQHCGNKFETHFYKSNKAKFCSSECKDNYYKSIKRNDNKLRHEENKKTCHYCQKQYVPYRDDQRFCSDECKINNHAKDQREERSESRSSIIKVCPVCEKQFTPQRRNTQKYCSRRCCYLFPKKIYKALQTCFKYSGEKKQDHSHKLLGYSHRQLQEHIMRHPNWQLVKDGEWHLDHVYPIIAFLEHGIKDISVICCLENLQPLSGKANCQKNRTYDKQEFTNWITRLGLWQD